MTREYGEPSREFNSDHAIRIPGIGEFREKAHAALEGKIKELSEKLANDPYKAPEQRLDVHYMLAIMEEALMNHEVDYQPMMEQLKSRFGQINQKSYDQAFNEIKNLVKP